VEVEQEMLVTVEMIQSRRRGRSIWGVGWVCERVHSVGCIKKPDIWVEFQFLSFLRQFVQSLLALLCTLLTLQEKWVSVSYCHRFKLRPATHCKKM
jgi:hypothetical protein